LIVDSSSKIDVLNVDNVTIDGNQISSTNTNGNLTLVANGSGSVVLNSATTIAGNTDITGTLTVTGQADVDNININGNQISTSNVNGDLTLATNGTGRVILDGNTVVVLPQGTDSNRPTAANATNGALRYSTEHHRFEGTVNGAWTSVGGVTDTDKDTYITAEQTSDDDTLRFWIAGTEKGTWNAAGLQIDNNIDVDGNADVAGTLGVTGDVTLAADASVAGALTVTGNTVIGGNLTVQGTTTTVQSTVTTLTDPVIHVGEGSIAAGDANDRGVSFEWGDGSAVQNGFFGLDMSTGRFSFQKILGSGDSTPDDNQFNSPWGDAQFNSLFLTGNQTVAGTSAVTGNATFAGTLGLTGVATLASSINVAGVVSANGGINTTAGDLTIAPAGGDTNVTGNLAVSGALSAASLSLTGALPVTSGGTGLQSFTGSGFFVSNAAGTAMSFITGSQYQLLQFDASGVPVASNTIDCGTF